MSHDPLGPFWGSPTDAPFRAPRAPPEGVQTVTANASSRAPSMARAARSREAARAWFGALHPGALAALDAARRQSEAVDYSRQVNALIEPARAALLGAWSDLRQRRDPTPAEHDAHNRISAALHALTEGALTVRRVRRRGQTSLNLDGQAAHVGIMRALRDATLEPTGGLLALAAIAAGLDKPCCDTSAFRAAESKWRRLLKRRRAEKRWLTGLRASAVVTTYAPTVVVAPVAGARPRKGGREHR